MYRSLIIYVAILFVLSALADNNISKEEKNQRYINNAIANVADKSIEISGKIIDKDGNPVENVNIRVSLSRNIMFAEKDDEEQKISADGSFAFKCTGYTHVTFYFSKTGFFDVENVGYGLKRSVDNIAERYDSVNFNNEKIVMYKVGNIGETLFSDIIWNNIAVNQLDGNIIPLSTLKPQEFTSLTECPNKYFSITAGDFANKENSQNDIPSRILYLTYISNDANDGFYKANSSDKLGLRGLPEAPATGYNIKRIPLFFSQNNPKENYLYYYFKNGNYYGKIKLFCTYFNQERNTINIRFYVITNIESNTEQRRNLRSDYFRY